MLAMKLHNNRGESIVEVLIVLVVLGSALTSSFLITQKATNANRTSLERSEATAFGQSQLERIKSVLFTTRTPSDVTAMDGIFCIDDNNTVQSVTDIANPQCTASNNLYHSYTSYDGISGIYTTMVFWDNLGGGQNKVKLVYRAYVSLLQPQILKASYV